MLNEIFILQTLILITLYFFTSTYNILTLWYLAGLYLLFLGFWLLLDDGDIFIGFLWVIDLGVGLIFFIFILHYSNFLHQKSFIEKSGKDFSFLFTSSITLLLVYFFFAQPFDFSFSKGLKKSWIFYLSWYDYYDFFFSYIVTDLNLIREIYFTNNSFEFFLINFLLFYGILSSILLTFLIKKMFNLLNLNQLTNTSFFTKINSLFFIRTQDFIKQQSTTNGTRVWLKKKLHKF